MWIAKVCILIRCHFLNWNNPEIISEEKFMKSDLRWYSDSPPYSVIKLNKLFILVKLELELRRFIRLYSSIFQFKTNEARNIYQRHHYHQIQIILSKILEKSLVQTLIN